MIRGEDLGKSMSSYLVDRIESTGNIEALAETEIRKLLGDEAPLEGMVVEDNRTGKSRTLDTTRAIFVFIGADANTGWLEGTLQLDEKGFVLSAVRTWIYLRWIRTCGRKAPGSRPCSRRACRGCSR